MFPTRVPDMAFKATNCNVAQHNNLNFVWSEQKVYDPLAADTNFAEIDFENFRNEDLAYAFSCDDEDTMQSSMDLSICRSEALFTSMRESMSKLNSEARFPDTHFYAHKVNCADDEPLCNIGNCPVDDRLCNKLNFNDTIDKTNYQLTYSQYGENEFPHADVGKTDKNLTTWTNVCEKRRFEQKVPPSCHSPLTPVADVKYDFRSEESSYDDHCEMYLNSSRPRFARPLPSPKSLHSVLNVHSAKIPVTSRGKKASSPSSPLRKWSFVGQRSESEKPGDGTTKSSKSMPELAKNTLEQQSGGRTRRARLMSPIHETPTPLMDTHLNHPTLSFLIPSSATSPDNCVVGRTQSSTGEGQSSPYSTQPSSSKDTPTRRDNTLLHRVTAPPNHLIDCVVDSDSLRFLLPPLPNVLFNSNVNPMFESHQDFPMKRHEAGGSNARRPTVVSNVCDSLSRLRLSDKRFQDGGGYYGGGGEMSCSDEAETSSKTCEQSDERSFLPIFQQFVKNQNGQSRVKRRFSNNRKGDGPTRDDFPKSGSENDLCDRRTSLLENNYTSKTGGGASNNSFEDYDDQSTGGGDDSGLGSGGGGGVTKHEEIGNHVHHTSSAAEYPYQTSVMGTPTMSASSSRNIHKRGSSASRGRSRLQRVSTSSFLDNCNDPVCGNGNVPPPMSSPFTSSFATVSSMSFNASGDLNRKRALFDNLYNAVENLLEIHSSSSDSNNHHRRDSLINQSTTTFRSETLMRYILLRQICPALEAIMADGLKDEVITSFGSIKTNVWSVVETLVRSNGSSSSALEMMGGGGGNCNSLSDLVLFLNSRFVLVDSSSMVVNTQYSSPSSKTSSSHSMTSKGNGHPSNFSTSRASGMGGGSSGGSVVLDHMDHQHKKLQSRKFAGFIAGLLHMSCLHTWFSKLKWNMDILLRFYHRFAFLCALNKETRLLFDEFVFCLQRLYAVVPSLPNDFFTFFYTSGSDSLQTLAPYATSEDSQFAAIHRLPPASSSFAFSDNFESPPSSVNVGGDDGIMMNVTYNRSMSCDVATQASEGGGGSFKTPCSSNSRREGGLVAKKLAQGGGQVRSRGRTASRIPRPVSLLNTSSANVNSGGSFTPDATSSSTSKSGGVTGGRNDILNRTAPPIASNIREGGENEGTSRTPRVQDTIRLFDSKLSGKSPVMSRRRPASTSSAMHSRQINHKHQQSHHVLTSVKSSSNQPYKTYI